MSFLGSDPLGKLLLVLVGGGLGSMCRYGVALMATHILGTRFPYGTLIVNSAGCFLIGACFELTARAAWFGPSARLFLMTGFLGGLTTFSTFALETVLAERQGMTPIALANFFANNAIGMGMVLSGIWSVQFFFKWRS